MITTSGQNEQTKASSNIKTMFFQWLLRTGTEHVEIV